MAAAAKLFIKDSDFCHAFYFMVSVCITDEMYIVSLVGMNIHLGYFVYNRDPIKRLVETRTKD